ncbi:MAG: winged helix-turn-helix domain-containing protein [Anaerolineales bacterium]
MVVSTERSPFESAVAAVRSGAVDYLLKPYEREELLSSVGLALLEKAERAKREQKKLLYEQVESSLKKLKEADGIEALEVPPTPGDRCGGRVMIDLDRREMWRGDESVMLTPNEGLLLSVFLENRSRVLSHQKLVMEVKQEEIAEDRAPEILRPMISRLRKKLEIFSGDRMRVKNVRGRGYVFDTSA